MPVPWKIINKLCDLSGEIYNDEIPEIIDDYILIKEIQNNKGLHGAIYKNIHKRICVIVFRGSSTLLDWFLNIFFIPTTIIQDVAVHYGFYYQLEDSINEISDCIKPNTKWYIAGHSRGAGLSTILTFLLSYRFPNIKWTNVTFGSPKVGTKKFAAKFNKKRNIIHYRIVINNDAISQLPSCLYRHTGKSIKKKKKWHYNNYEEKISCPILCGNYNDHNYYNYKNNIVVEVS